MPDGPWTQYQQTAAAPSPQGPWTQYAEQGEQASPDQHEGFWKALGSDLYGMVKSAPKMALNLVTMGLSGDVERAKAEYQAYKQGGQTLESQQNQQRKEAGYGPAYRYLAAPAAQSIGVNVPGIEQAAARGDQGAIAGHSVAPLVPLAAGNLAGALGKRLAAPVQSAGEAAGERLYQSALKPSVAKYSTEQVKNMVQTGIQNKIPVSAAGSEKLASLVSDLNDAVKAEIQGGANAGATISRKAVASRLLDTASKFKNQVAPDADLQAIRDVGNEFYKNQPPQIPVDQAQALKQGTYQQLRGKYGQMSAARIEAEKALARGIKEELQNQFPEIKNLNAEEAKLINLDGALDRAVRRIDNHQLMGIGTPLAAGAGAAATGSPIGAVAGGVIKLALDDPILKSKLAFVLSKAGRGVTIPAATARVAGYAAALSPEKENSQ